MICLCWLSKTVSLRLPGAVLARLWTWKQKIARGKMTWLLSTFVCRGSTEFGWTVSCRRRSYPSKPEQEARERPIRFAVRSLGWVEIAEEDLTPERSSKAVNKCIVDLSVGKNDLLDVVGRWGDVSWGIWRKFKLVCDQFLGEGFVHGFGRRSFKTYWSGKFDCFEYSAYTYH